MLNILFETIQTESVISFPFLGNLLLDPPSSFTVGKMTIHFYGVFIALGFLLGMLYCAKKSGSFGIREDDLYDLLLLLIPLSIVGARLYFVLCKPDYYFANPEKIIAVWEGGLAIYGGVIAGALVIVAVCRKKKVPIPAMLDLMIFGLLIGQIIGRWGNFMNREAFGRETEIFCRMGLTDPAGNTIYVHPTFLYESLWNLAGFVFLAVWTGKGKRRYDGQCTLIYFLWYGIGRFWIEGLRTDSLYIPGTEIRTSQALSAVLALAALVLLVILGRKPHGSEALYANRVNSQAEPAEEAAAPDSQQKENL